MKLVNFFYLYVIVAAIAVFFIYGYLYEVVK